MRVERLSWLLLVVCLVASRAAADFYGLSAVDIEGNEVAMERYRGKVSLVVNVASRCGFTDVNYKELVQLQESFEPRGFTVLAFPCNQFLNQEPATNKEILDFTREKYNINFPMFSKVDVKGEYAHEIYRYLAHEVGQVPLWNFNKYLIDRDGTVVQHFTQKDTFDSIRKSLKYLLSKQSEL